jgi:hypothetical protein
MRAEDRAAKLGMIVAFFENLEAKIAFAAHLERSGHLDEALLLTCCYIEGLGNSLALSQGGAESFVEALRLHGGDSRFDLIIPTYLSASLPYKSTSAESASFLRTWLGSLPQFEAISRAELSRLSHAAASPEAVSFLATNCWRGTLANIAYVRIRSFGVHHLGSPDFVSFSKSTHQGVALPDIDFVMLHGALNNIVAHAKNVSLRTNRWFGIQ